MKKLVFLAVAMVAISFSSCGNKTAQTQPAEDTIVSAEEVVAGQDTIVAVSDTVVPADSVKAAQ